MERGENLRAKGQTIRYLIFVVATRQVHNLALIGFMGTGKSSVGRMVADALHFTFLDTDDVITARAGKSITEIFQQNGEAVRLLRIQRHRCLPITGVRDGRTVSPGGLILAVSQLRRQGHKRDAPSCRSDLVWSTVLLIPGGPECP